MSNICLFCSQPAWSNTSTSHDSFHVKPLCVRDESVTSTCLSPLLAVDLVPSQPEADIFSFLLASWPPFWPCPGPLAGALRYLLPRELCVQRVNTAWLVEQGSNLLLTLSHIHTKAEVRTKTHSQSHVTVPGGWQRCLPQHNRSTQ